MANYSGGVRSRVEYPTKMQPKDKYRAGVLQCKCDQDAVLRTVKKEGPNNGKGFFCCEKNKDMGGCTFFKWCEEGPIKKRARTESPTEDEEVTASTEEAKSPSSMKEVVLNMARAISELNSRDQQKTLELIKLREAMQQILEVLTREDGKKIDDDYDDGILTQKS